ncbi:MAG: hypothetical protein ACRYHQ_24810 [Janthinobacterium lividum]
MRKNFGTDPRSARQDYFAQPLVKDRPLTARELQLASDLELARGNHQRGELLSWKAHLARTGTVQARQAAP